MLFDRDDKKRNATHIVVESCQLGLQEDRLWLFELGKENQVNFKSSETHTHAQVKVKVKCQRRVKVKGQTRSRCTVKQEGSG